uniref:DUF4283 domain-containing protein n=1 Tax=Lactuca sativa TaxID=4236 RepID=A0A9R1VX55_LACSA|nr:hypothetical protein LSAT_V11C400156940 [Lactuca sativa]
MFGKIGNMFGMNYTDPLDPDNLKVYEDELDADVGARRRGRRAVHKGISPYAGEKPLRSKGKFESKAIRIQEEKKYLSLKSPIERSKVVLRAGVRDVIKSGYGKENVDPEFIKAELDAFEKAIEDEKKMELHNKSKSIGMSKLKNEMVEEKGFVMLPVTSDMLEGFISSKDIGSANRHSSQSPDDESISSRGLKASKDLANGSSSSVSGYVNEANNDKGILGESPLSQIDPNNLGSSLISDLNPSGPINCSTSCNDEDMKDLMNENENVDFDAGNNEKLDQGVNFLKTDFSKPVISPAAKMVSDFNKKSYARMVEATNTVVDLNIKVIPKVEGKSIGKVELPYADLMLGGAPYHATLYGFFVGKKLAFPTVNHFSFKMWKTFGLKDIMVNDEGFFFFKFDSKEGMMSVLEGGPCLLTIKGITVIANEIGKPIAMDKITQKMCNEHWGRPAFMRFLVEMSAESEWIKELSVISIDFGTGEKVESKCRVEYAWRPDVCTHCKIYGHKNSNCGILNCQKTESVADVVKTEDGNGKKEQVDEEGFILVTKKNNKGLKANSGVVINENGKVDLIKSLEKNTVPAKEEDAVSKSEEISKAVGDQGNQKRKQVEKQEIQKENKNEDSISKGADKRNDGGNFSKYAVGNLKKDGIERGAFQSRESKKGKMNGTGVFIPKEKLGTRVKNVIENFNARKDEMQGKKEEGQKKVYVPKKQVEFKVSSNFDNVGSSSGKDDQEVIFSKNPFDILSNDLGLRDMSYLDEIDPEIITGGGQEINTENLIVDQ